MTNTMPDGSTLMEAHSPLKLYDTFAGPYVLSCEERMRLIDRTDYKYDQPWTSFTIARLLTVSYVYLSERANGTKVQLHEYHPRQHTISYVWPEFDDRATRDDLLSCLDRSTQRAVLKDIV